MPLPTTSARDWMRPAATGGEGVVAPRRARAARRRVPAAQEPGGWSCTKLACASDHLLGQRVLRTPKSEWTRYHGLLPCALSSATLHAYPASSPDAHLRRYALPPRRT